MPVDLQDATSSQVIEQPARLFTTSTDIAACAFVISSRIVIESYDDPKIDGIEFRVAQVVEVCLVRVFYSRDELRLQPAAFGHLVGRQTLAPSALVALRQIRKGACLDFEPVQTLENLDAKSRDKPVPDPRNVDEVVALVNGRRSASRSFTHQVRRCQHAPARGPQRCIAWNSSGAVSDITSPTISESGLKPVAKQSAERVRGFAEIWPIDHSQA
jgi:hypothetical protein